MFTAFGFISIDHGGRVSEAEQYLLTITTSFEYSKPVSAQENLFRLGFWGILAC